MAGAATTSQINGGTSNQTAAADGASKAAVKKATKAAKVAIDPEVIRQRRAEKAARREAEAEANKGKEPEPVKLGFTAREFVRIPGASAAHCSDGQRHSERPKRRIKVMTWNVRWKGLPYVQESDREDETDPLFLADARSSIGSTHALSRQRHATLERQAAGFVSRPGG